MTFLHASIDRRQIPYIELVYNFLLPSQVLFPLYISVKLIPKTNQFQCFILISILLIHRSRAISRYVMVHSPLFIIISGMSEAREEVFMSSDYTATIESSPLNFQGISFKKSVLSSSLLTDDRKDRSQTRHYYYTIYR